ncbi:hypothetical protein ACP70R_043260 [Stipagrostis hirtigluma subsp. patula]
MAAEHTKLAEEHLLRAPANDRRDAAVDRQDGGGGFSWLTALGFAFLTFNSGMAIYRSDGDPAAVAFVAFSYIDLVLLFWCLRLFERAAPGSSTRANLKAAVWVLTTLLTVVFSYKVAAIMPLPVQILVWAMAGATVMGGFYAFFIHREGKLLCGRLRAWQKFDKEGPVLVLVSVGPLLEQIKFFTSAADLYGRHSHHGEHPVVGYIAAASAPCRLRLLIATSIAGRHPTALNGEQPIASKRKRRAAERPSARPPPALNYPARRKHRRYGFQHHCF